MSATTLGVSRVGIWSLEEDRTTLRLVALHDGHSATTSLVDDARLSLAKWPAYLAAVLSRRVVAATNALTDPRTAELAETYLRPRGVTSMMDAPLFVGGEVYGIVCHEHIGDVRDWSSREVDFAASVADMLSALLEQSMRLAVEARLRAAEAELARVAQADAVVRTAAAIGHDINTLLQAITASAERAAREDNPADRSAALGSVVNDCRRVSRVVDQLRELERPGSPVDAEADLSFVIDDTRSTLAALLGSTHRLATELAPQATVAARRADVERILVNLVVNAKEAMPHGGTVTVAVRRSATETTLEVRDEGRGISAEDAGRVFVPYFTTKTGRNAGLGLFAVQTIARTTGATVAFSSEPGAGTVVTVSWPSSGANTSS